jgi:hypothetical protein
LPAVQPAQPSTIGTRDGGTVRISCQNVIARYDPRVRIWIRSTRIARPCSTRACRIACASPRMLPPSTRGYWLLARDSG